MLRAEKALTVEQVTSNLDENFKGIKVKPEEMGIEYADHVQ